MDFRNESFEHERAEDHDSGNSSHSDQGLREKVELHETMLEYVAGKTEAASVAGRIADGLRAPMPLAGKEVSAAASIGIALSDSAHDRPKDLLREADSAMYEAKNNKQP